MRHNQPSVSRDHSSWWHQGIRFPMRLQLKTSHILPFSAICARLQMPKINTSFNVSQGRSSTGSKNWTFPAHLPALRVIYLNVLMPLFLDPFFFSFIDFKTPKLSKANETNTPRPHLVVHHPELVIRMSLFLLRLSLMNAKKLLLPTFETLFLCSEAIWRSSETTLVSGSHFFFFKQIFSIWRLNSSQSGWL